MYTGLKCQGKTPLDYEYTLRKKSGQKDKNRSFLRVSISGRGTGIKESVNEGGCIWYSYMKKE
jgi:hypothetical protein